MNCSSFAPYLTCYLEVIQLIISATWLSICWILLRMVNISAVFAAFYQWYVYCVFGNSPCHGVKLLAFCDLIASNSLLLC